MPWRTYLKNVVNRAKSCRRRRRLRQRPRRGRRRRRRDVVERRTSSESSRIEKVIEKRARRPRRAVHRVYRETEVEDGQIPRRPREGGSSDEHRASRRRPKRPSAFEKMTLTPSMSFILGVRRLCARRDGGVRGGPATRDTCLFRGRDGLVVGIGGNRQGTRINIE